MSEKDVQQYSGVWPLYSKLLEAIVGRLEPVDAAQKTKDETIDLLWANIDRLRQGYREAQAARQRADLKLAQAGERIRELEAALEQAQTDAALEQAKTDAEVGRLVRQSWR